MLQTTRKHMRIFGRHLLSMTLLSYNGHNKEFTVLNSLLLEGIITKDTTWTRYPTDEIFGGLPVNSDTWRRSCNWRYQQTTDSQ